MQLQRRQALSASLSCAHRLCAGGFLILHLLVNSLALWPGKFQAAVNRIHSLGALLPVLEIGLAAILSFHIVVAGPGFRDADGFHHHHAAIDEQSGTGAAAGKLDSSKPAAPLRVHVAGRNQIQREAREMPLAEFKAELARLKIAQAAILVVVEGGDRADYQAMANVLVFIQQLDTTQASRSTTAGSA